MTVVFVALGWGYLLLFIAILVVIVMLHERPLRDAKRAGMKVTEFFVGFGPRLWSFRRGETEYGVKAILVGGYVRIIGMSRPPRRSTPADEPRTYRQQPFHQPDHRGLGGLGHALPHRLRARLILVVSFGQPRRNNYTIASVEHWSGRQTAAPRRPACKAGDRIVAIDGNDVQQSERHDQRRQASAGKPLTLGVERDGRLIHLTATPADGTGITVGGEQAREPGLPRRRIKQRHRCRSRSCRPSAAP